MNDYLPPLDQSGSMGEHQLDSYKLKSEINFSGPPFSFNLYDFGTRDPKIVICCTDGQPQQGEEDGKTGMLYRPGAEC